MKNIIMAKWHQMMCSKLLIRIFVVMMLVQTVMVLSETMYGTPMSASEFITKFGNMLVTFGISMALVATGDICGGDFLDKTCNHELMGGFQRREIYGAKVILSVAVGLISFFFSAGLSVALPLFIGGWGNVIAPQDFFVRFLLLVFPVFRIICIFVCLNYIIKNGYIGMCAGIGAFFVFVFDIGRLLPVKDWSAIGAISELTDYTLWETYSLCGGEVITIYDAGVVITDVAKMSILSVLVGMAFLWIGYQFFKRDDMR